MVNDEKKYAGLSAKESLSVSASSQENTVSYQDKNQNKNQTKTQNFDQQNADQDTDMPSSNYKNKKTEGVQVGPRANASNPTGEKLGSNAGKQGGGFNPYPNPTSYT